MNARTWADIVAGPTNRFVREKVAQKQQGSGGGGGQPPGGGGGRPPGDGDDWQPDKKTQKKVKDRQLADHRQRLHRDAGSRLEAKGFAKGDFTYVCPLAATVSAGQQRDMATHVTVNIDDLDKVTRSASRETTLGQVLGSLPYHVTVEEYDERSEANNPRWYSSDRKWNTQGSKHGAGIEAPGQTAVDQARAKMLALRT